jgi:hypothetical protein
MEQLIKGRIGKALEYIWCPVCVTVTSQFDSAFAFPLFQKYELVRMLLKD